MKTKLIAVLSALIISFGAGWQWRGAIADTDVAEMMTRLFAKQTEASEKAREIEQLKQDASDLVARIAALRSQERNVITETIHTESIRYVPEPIPTDCPAGPDYEWLRIHNLAAAGELPGISNSTSNTDDVTPGIGPVVR